jgi:hypothetical protein
LFNRALFAILWLSSTWALAVAAAPPTLREALANRATMVYQQAMMLLPRATDPLAVETLIGEIESLNSEIAQSDRVAADKGSFIIRLNKISELLSAQSDELGSMATVTIIRSSPSSFDADRTRYLGCEEILGTPSWMKP